MIISRNSIGMAEAKQYLHKSEEKEAEINAFIEKFVKISPEQAKDLREKIEGLDIIKIKEEHISKMEDMLPGDSDDLHQIFTDVGLDEDETKKILEIVKEFK